MTNIAFQVPPLFDYFATFLWALSGAILGMHKRYDMAGVCVIAFLAATGGSTLRDGLFLNKLPPVVTNVWVLAAGPVRRLGDLSSSRRGRLGLDHHRPVLHHPGAGSTL